MYQRSSFAKRDTVCHSISGFFRTCSNRGLRRALETPSAVRTLAAEPAHSDFESAAGNCTVASLPAPRSPRRPLLQAASWTAPRWKPLSATPQTVFGSSVPLSDARSRATGPGQAGSCYDVVAVESEKRDVHKRSRRHTTAATLLKGVRTATGTKVLSVAVKEAITSTHVLRTTAGTEA